MKIEMIPGAILQGAIMGALRIQNKSAKAVASEHGLDYTHFRNACFGMSMNTKAAEFRERIIDLVGREMVEHLYTTRMLEEAEKLKKAASQWHQPPLSLIARPTCLKLCPKVGQTSPRVLLGPRGLFQTPARHSRNTNSRAVATPDRLRANEPRPQSGFAFIKTLPPRFSVT